MNLPLPNLDDRRWQDLVEEGQALIPLFEPEWTDHNVHDPGIMLVELLAWVSEMDIYWLNRIPESHILKFLALAGYTPRPPLPAHSAAAFSLKPNEAHFYLPGGVHLAGQDGSGNKVLFSTTQGLNVIPGALAGLQRKRGETWVDLSTPLSRGEQPYLLGEDPQPGDALYLGFSQPLPPDVEASLYLSLSGECSSRQVWERLAGEARWRAAFCPPALPPCDPSISGTQDVTHDTENHGEHHSVRLIWEYNDSSGIWQPLDPQMDQARDGTRALSLEGSLGFRIPGPMGSARLGNSSQDLYYLRARIASGSYDAAPRLISLALNGVEIVQEANILSHTWTILPNAAITGSPPAAGLPAAFEFQKDAEDRITALDFKPDGPPGFTLLAFRPPLNGLTGRLTVAAEALPAGDGSPDQARQLKDAPVSGAQLKLLSREEDHWVEWQTVADLLNSQRDEAHYLLDATTGQIRFGDGENGRVLPENARLFAAYASTLAQDGNLASKTVNELVQDAHNRALLPSPQDTASKLARITNPVPAAGGLSAETLDQLEGRALADLRRPTRAVTLTDIEQLALQTPGTCLARVTAIPNMHPAYPCYQAPGVITVIILPFLPHGRPRAAQGLVRLVQAYLDARRVVGSRMLVTGPQYHEAAVRAQVQMLPGSHPLTVKTAIEGALDSFFDPLTGGPDGSGWPFGRKVYRSEVLQVLDETPGVDHVLDLELIDEDGQASCGNLCLHPLELVAAGPHQIEVIEA